MSDIQDGRCITDAAIWRDLNNELILPSMRDDAARTCSLIQAYLKSGDDSVRELLASECESGEVIGDSMITLSRAVASNSAPTVELLLQRGADPNVDEEKSDSSPLIEAAKEGFELVMETLIKHGASVSQSTSTGHVALHYAAANGHLNCVKLLLRHGSSLEEQNENGHTPLMEATSNGHMEVARCLIEHGANINTHSTEFKESALTLASYKGHPEMVKFLLDAGASHEHRTDEMHTALMEAAMEGHVEVARLLLDHGANVNIPLDSFESPLTLAACGGHTELVHLLIGYEADIEEVNDEGYTPLMEASREGHEDTVAVLLAAGADVNTKTEETQESALTLAACGGFVEICEMLLKAGADIEVGNNGCSTALMEAAQEGHLELVRRLLERGANLHAITTSGDTALNYAAENGHLKVCQELLAWGAGHNQSVVDGAKTPLMKAARSGHLDVVRLLVEYGFSVNQTTTENDATALSLACNGGHAQVVEYLLRNGADPAHELRDGCTMIIECARSGSPTVARLIIDYPHSLTMALTATPTAPTSQSLHQPSPPPLTQPLQQLQIGTPGDILMEATTADFHQRAAVAMQQQHRGGMQPLPTPNPQLKEALAKAYAAGWSDGAASRRQHQTVSQQACGDAQIGPVLQIRAGDEAVTSTTPTRQEAGVDGLTDLPQLSSTDEFSSRLVALFHECKGDSAEFLHRLGSVMAFPANSVCATQASSHGSVANSDSQDASGIGNLIDAFDPPATITMPPATIMPFASATTASSSSTLSSAAAGVLSTRSSESSSSSSSSGSSSCILSSSIQLIDTHLVVAPPPTAAVYYQQQQQSAGPMQTMPLQQSSEGMVTDALQPSSSETITGAVDPALYDQLISCPTAAATIGTQPSPPISTTIQPPITQVDINACTEGTNESALTLACNGGFVDLARLLLERGADKEHRDKKSHTPLHTAVYATQRPIVTLLLEYGVDIEAQVDRTKDTALSIACSHGRLDIAEDLLNRGANKEHRNFSDYTPLSLAASGGYIDVIQLLLRYGAEINSRTGSKLGISPLMLASMNGYTEAVRILLEHGSDINAQIETNRNTALTLACFQGQHEVVKLLVQRNANIEHRAKTGLTPLMEAASGNHVKVGCILLQHGADVNCLPVLSSRDTALTIAADKGKTDFVDLLLQHGAIVEARNKKGATPLWLACNGGHLEVVERLIVAKADVNSQDNRKVSCLMAAFRKGHVKVVNLLVQHVTQFPSDKDCQQQIKAVAHDKDLAERCQQCRTIISTAKEKQEGEARKNASVLLEQIEQEEEERANKEAMQARKRERKRNKRKAKQEAAAAESAKEKAVFSEVVSKEASSTKSIEQQPSVNLVGAILEAEEFIPTPQSVQSPIHSNDTTVNAFVNYEPQLLPKLEFEPSKKKSKQRTSQARTQSVDQPSPKEPGTSKLMASQPSSTDTKHEESRSKKQSQRTKPASLQQTVEAAVSPMLSATGAEPETSDLVLWDTSGFDHSSDSTSGNDWFVVPPTGLNRSHRAVNQADTISGNDWKISGSSGSGGSAKRKLAISVSKHDIGKIIGQGGAVVSALRNMSGIQIDIESARGDEVMERMVYLKGPGETVQRTYQIIQDLLSGALAGSEVIARSKTSTKPGSVSSLTAPSSNTSRSGVSSSRKIGSVGNTTTATTAKVVPLQCLSAPQPLMSAKVINPNLTIKASSSNVSKIASTPSTSWAVTKAPQRCNFASVAAAGAALNQQLQSSSSIDSKNRAKSLTMTIGPIAPLLAVTIAAISECPKNSSIFSTASLPLLDEKSFPPLSTITSVASTSTTVTSKPAEPVPSTPCPPTIPVKTIKAPSPPLAASASNASATALSSGSSKAFRKQPDSIMVPISGEPPALQVSRSLPISRLQPTPIVSSRTFALAPGSERTANRHAGGTSTSISSKISGMTTSPAGSVPTKRANPATTVAYASGGSSNAGNDSLFSSHPDNISPSSNPPPQPTVTMQNLEALFNTIQNSMLQSTTSSLNQFDPTSNSMWSDFGTSAANDTSFQSYDYLSGRGANPSAAAASSGANASSNYASLQNLGIRNFESIANAAMVEDNAIPRHLYPNYRLSHQSQLGSSGSGGIAIGNPNAYSSSTPFMVNSLNPDRSDGVNSALAQRDYALFNSANSTSAISNSNNSNLSNTLLSRLNPLNSEQSMVQQPSSNMQAKSQQAFLQQQQQHHPSFNMGISSPQIPPDQSFYLGPSGTGHASYSGVGSSLPSGGSSSNYGFPSVGRVYPSIPQRQQQQESQSSAHHQKPTPIGAERRRPPGVSNPASVVTTTTDVTGQSASAPQSVLNSVVAAANQAYVALLLQQQQQQQQQTLQESLVGGGSTWTQPLQSSQHHTSFWPQELSGGGIGASSGQAQHQQQQSLMANTAAAVAALANLCPWPNQMAASCGSSNSNPNVSSASGHVAANWMMSSPFHQASQATFQQPQFRQPPTQAAAIAASMAASLQASHQQSQIVLEDQQVIPPPPPPPQL